MPTVPNTRVKPFTHEHHAEEEQAHQLLRDVANRRGPAHGKVMHATQLHGTCARWVSIRLREPAGGGCGAAVVVVVLSFNVGTLR